MSCMAVWDVFHVLLGRTFMSGLRTKKTLKTFKKQKYKKFIFIKKTRFLQPCLVALLAQWCCQL